MRGLFGSERTRALLRRNGGTADETPQPRPIEPPTLAKAVPHPIPRPHFRSTVSQPKTAISSRFARLVGHR